MKIDNKIDNVFGENAIFAGYLFLFTGLLFLYFMAIVAGILIVAISGFVITSYSGVEIDTDKRIIRQYDKLFGIFKTGKWKSLESFRGVTYIPFIRTERISSMSNRINSVKKIDHRIYLVDKGLKPAFAIKKCNTMEEAQCSLDEFSLWLKLPVFSVKR